MLFREDFQTRPYYSSGRDWNDYEPAYRYGLQQYAVLGGADFERSEARLEAGWPPVSEVSRLGWMEARSAVFDAWREASLRWRRSHSN